MNVLAAAQELNRKAAEQGWYHFCDPTLAFKDPIYEQFLSLWKNKAGARPLPMRTEMTPRDLKDFLRDLVIFQRVSLNPSRYCWRLIGTKVTEVAGHNTGKTFEESIPSEHLPRWIECGDLLLDGGAPLRFLGRVHLNGREYLDAENLFVPLGDENGDPNYAMGLCHYTPRRTQKEESWAEQIAAIPSTLF